MSRRASHAPAPHARSEDWVVLLCAIAAFAAPSLLSFLVAATIAAFAWNMNQAATLRRRLRRKGYDWVDIEQAQYLCHAVGKRALARLPARSDVEMIPSYVAGRPETLAALALLLERQRPVAPPK
jgi:hypothetical protein